MKKLTIASIIAVLVFNLIFSIEVRADYPNEISGSIQSESLNEIEQATDPNLAEDMADSGETSIYPGTKQDEDTYEITEETTTARNTTSTGGALAGILAQVINIFPTMISSIMSYFVISQEDSNFSIEEFSIQDLVFGKFKLFNIDFFDVPTTGDDANTKIKQMVAKWYVAIRKLAIVIALVLLIYIGIRMTISTLGDDKAKYKKMLINWLIGFCLIFLFQYIATVAITVSEGILEIIPEQNNNLEATILEGNGNADSKALKNKMSNTKGWNYVTACILYWIIIYYQLKFLLLYLKRLLSTALLLLISPLISATYCIDKVKDDKAQAYKNWLKEFLVNVFIQPLHAIIYIVFIASAAEIAAAAPLLAILFFGALSRGEKIIKNIFNMRGLSSINSIATLRLRRYI
ncbi:MAG TPA: hypothetical protein IAB70_04025 [Candidatus Merdicola faecigallinarum]|uniref:Uncharacterized protein n=1 Tax=Candidatus Merdicola faecigallinarum TaxID=2840862 RepID=A0A9D1M1B4_9FIRM|nr:hypothetical protein [Candidatus Merdicola faecigallinarum]